MFVLGQYYLYTSKISLKPFQLRSKKNSGISPSMNLSHSFSLSLLDLHLTFKNIIINCKICEISYTYQLSEFRIRKSVKISSHTIVPKILSFKASGTPQTSCRYPPFAPNIKTENLLRIVISRILCVCLQRKIHLDSIESI